jgi:hypothetical protein
MRRFAPVSLLLSAVLCGCPAGVGTTCTEEDYVAATTPVYAPDGTPSYPGQSLLLTSCGGGSFCHSEGATMRYGAPHDLNFDAILADSPGFSDLATGSARLLRIQGTIHRERNEIYETVVDGSMPPGPAGQAVQRDRYRTYLDDSDPVGTELPSLGTPEGREILRRWLACGSPVVDTEYATTPPSCEADVDCPVTHNCDEALHECASVGAFIPHRVGHVTPTWSYIYPAIVRPTCASNSACHNGGTLSAGGLDMATSEGARMALVGIESVLPGCGTRVVAGDPDMSFLISKLEGTMPDTCGSQMPISTVTLSAEQIDLFRTWIMNGALND